MNGRSIFCDIDDERDVDKVPCVLFLQCLSAPVDAFLRANV